MSYFSAWRDESEANKNKLFPFNYEVQDYKVRVCVCIFGSLFRQEKKPKNAFLNEHSGIVHRHSVITHLTLVR